MDTDGIQFHQREITPAQKTSPIVLKAAGKTPGAKLNGQFAVTFLVCMATWLVLSGKFDGFHIALGLVSSLIVALFSGDLLIGDSDVRRLPVTGWRFLKFTPWLLYQVFIANLHVMRLVFHPRMNELISPRIIRFRSRLQNDMSRFVLANAITLTPGTITVFASILGNYTVHVIDARSEAGVPGEMETRIAAIYGED